MSFKEWLINKVLEIKKKENSKEFPIFWYDPTNEWKELICSAFSGKFSIWNEFEHTLKTRFELIEIGKKPDIVWLPFSKEKLEFLKAFEPYTHNWETSILEAVKDYGVNITHDKEQGLKPLIRSYAMEWLDEPIDKWRNLTASGADLVNDRLILETISGFGKPLSKFIETDKWEIFKRRIDNDYCLEEPQDNCLNDKDLSDKWRIKVVSMLLATEIFINLPFDSFSRNDLLIKDGSPRKSSINLLNQMRKDIDIMPYFEKMVFLADKTLDLNEWVKNNYNYSTAIFSSNSAEKTLYEHEIQKLVLFSSISEIAHHFDKHISFYEKHSESFWAKNSEKKLNWGLFLAIAEASKTLDENDGIENDWLSIEHAINWYYTNGWKVDSSCELAYEKISSEYPALNKIVNELKNSYLRLLDKTNTAFSELISKDSDWHSKLNYKYSGDLLRSKISKSDNIAIIIADALRLELAKKIENDINSNGNFALTEIVKAPIPTITSLGMPFTLPIDSNELKLNINSDKTPNILYESIDLSIAEERRKWMKKNYKLDDSNVLTFKAIIENNFTIPSGKLIYITMDEFDSQGHEGELEFSGTEDIIEKFKKIIRLTRDKGYNKCYILTDHGYFHYYQENDETIDTPTGEIMFKSRRAFVGKNLIHKTAVKTKIQNYEALTPRSISAFKTYGNKGFYHGGTTLQEVIIPFVTITWSKKFEKIGVVIKPIQEIATMEPRIEVEPTNLQNNLFGEGIVDRQIRLKIKDMLTGKLLFISSVETIKPSDAKRVISLKKQNDATGQSGLRLRIEAIDADNEEVLSSYDSILKIELDEWF